MQGAKTESWCAAAAIANAAECHGRRVSQRRAADLASIGPDGTHDEHAVLTALDALGFAVAEIRTGHRGTARDWLDRLSGVLPLILCVDDWEHWVAVVGRCGPRVLVADGFGARGPDVVRAVRPARLLRRWRAAARSAGGAGGEWYGIAVWHAA